MEYTSNSSRGRVGSELSASSPSQEIKKKRRCETCRVTHQKCDAGDPVCGTCIKLHRECIYTEAPRTPSAPFNRTQRACMKCRKQKRKCDGLTPSCGPCFSRNLGAECEYDLLPTRQRPSLPRPETPSSLSDRPTKFPRLSLPSSIVRNIGTKEPTVPPVNSTLSNGFHSEIDDTPSTMADDTDDTDDDQQRRSDSKTPSRPSGPFFDLLLNPEEPADSSRKNSINSGKHKGKTGSRKNRHKGGLPWATKLNEAILHRTDKSKPGHTRQSEDELTRLTEVRRNNPGLVKVRPDGNDLILPSRQVADRLMAVYLTREYVNLPIFDLPAFQAKYMELWSSEDLLGDLGVFRGILNAVFALGCIATDPNNQNDATMYFIKAQRLIRFGCIDGDNLTTVQAHLIASQYLLAISNLDAAWKSIGAAIRVAGSLRLHLGSGSHHLKEGVDRELARRIWHSCIVLERTIALHLGPNTIVTPRSSQAPLPAPLENEYVDTIFGGEPMIDSERPSIIEFFTSSSRLFERYEDIVSIQEDLRPIRRSPSKILESFDSQKLLNADRILCNWVATLPPFLQPDTNHGSLQNAIAQRQHNILRIRYLHIRLLLWRPLLALVAASPNLIPHSSPISRQQKIHTVIETPIIYTIAYKGAGKSILSALGIIDILTENCHPDGKLNYLGPVPSWWENIEYVYTCALVFLAARYCPSSIHKELPGAVEQGWHGSIRLLDEYRAFSPKAGAYLTALESLAATHAAFPDDTMNNHGGIQDDQDCHHIRDMTWLEALPIDLPI